MTKDNVKRSVTPDKDSQKAVQVDKVDLDLVERAKELRDKWCDDKHFSARLKCLEEIARFAQDVRDEERTKFNDPLHVVPGVLVKLSGELKKERKLADELAEWGNEIQHTPLCISMTLYRGCTCGKEGLEKALESHRQMRDNSEKAREK